MPDKPIHDYGYFCSEITEWHQWQLAHEHISETHLNQKLSSNPDDFSANVTERLLSNAAISHVRATPNIFDRTSSHVAQVPMDVILIQYYLSTTGCFIFNELSTQEIQSGDVVIHDMLEPSRSSMAPMKSSASSSPAPLSAPCSTWASPIPVRC